MPTHYSTCLYIHGLHSHVTPEKRNILEANFDNVVAFDVDYSVETDIFERLKRACRDNGVDFIIGSSFGGYLGFYLASELGLPSVLFNPALFYSLEDKTYVKSPSFKAVPFSLFVIGEKDDTVPPATTEKFIKEHPAQTNIQVMKCSWLEHRIDLATFESAISSGIILSSH
ncbi:MAG: hypothetical protein GY751_08670 [Bacteroidetes bacterium]|nr:hypothetical protein [Bacteroidota bacterium]